MKSIAKGLVSLNVLALLVTAASAWLLGRSSASDLLDTATYVGLGMGGLTWIAIAWLLAAITGLLETA